MQKGAVLLQPRLRNRKG